MEFVGLLQYSCESFTNMKELQFYCTKPTWCIYTVKAPPHMRPRLLAIIRDLEQYSVGPDRGDCLRPQPPKSA